MSSGSNRLFSRQVHAIIGTITLGLLLPGIAFWSAWHSPLEQLGAYIGLGIAFAAYTTHAFLLNPRPARRGQRTAFAVTILLGLSYAAWLQPVEGLVGSLAQPFEAPLPPGQDFGGFQVGFTATHIVTGLIMAACLFATTRSLRVALTVAIASLVCGLVVLVGWGISSIPWNLCAAIALYSWACSGAAAAPGPPLCRKCGYTLAGLPGLRCPECGELQFAPNRT